MTIRLRAPALARAAAFCAIAISFALATVSNANAQGTITIQHSGQNAETYARVAIKVIHNTLNVTSEDGAGTLIVTRAACFYQHELFVCLPTAVTLVQSGGVHALDLHRGTIYTNLTSGMLSLPHSTTQVPPNGVVMSLLSGKGTYINLVGTIDKVVK
jgi:hypothetical protein